MSSFWPAVRLVLEQEGGYVDDPQDRGGETKFGISKRSHPDVDIQGLTLRKAVEIYRARYWRSYYAEITDQRIANKLFSLAVNMGHGPAQKCLQRAIRGAGLPAVKVDGVLGPKTIRSVNDADPGALLASFRSEAACYYRGLNQPRFVDGWENRAYA